MSLEVKLGSYYFNSMAGVLFAKTLGVDGSVIVANNCYMYPVTYSGKANVPEFELEYECDKYGNELYTEAQTECDTQFAFAFGDKVIYEDCYGNLQLGYVSYVMSDNEISIKPAVGGTELVRNADDVYDYECLPCYDTTDYGEIKVLDDDGDCNYLCIIEDNEDFYLQLIDKQWLHESGKLVTEYSEYIDDEHNVEKRKHSHYFKDVSNLDEIDVYAVLTLFEVTDPCIAHAVKKLLCTGNRGHKDFETDAQDALDSLVRWKELNQDLTK